MPDSANEHLDQIEALIARRQPRVIVDVGMGRGSYGWFLRQRCLWKGKLHGVEVWAPYVIGPDAIAGGNRAYYDQIHIIDVRDALDLIAQLHPDVVFAFDVIEHMVKEDGVRVLRGLQRASMGSVLVSLPIVDYPQGPHNGNPHEEHKHQWKIAEMISLGAEFRHKGEVTGLFDFPGGGVDKLVTVMMNTVREDSATGGRHALRSVTDCLRSQTLPASEFEFVCVDGVFPYRAETFYEHDYPFRILHVPPRHTAMVRDRRCAISAYKNTGIAHARGQLLVSVDDCCSFGPDFLEQYWKTWSEEGVMLQGLYKADDSLSINDARVVFLGEDGKCTGPVGGDPNIPPMYGFASIPIQAALDVNGYDEMFDGSRGLEDCDMGVRLQQAGYRIRLDRRQTLSLTPQGPWSDKVFGDNVRPGTTEDNTCVKCCETTYRIQRDRSFARANTQPWTDADWARVAPRCQYLTPDGTRCSLNMHLCPHVGRCSDREHPGLVALRSPAPLFELRQLRTDNGIR